MEQAKSVAYGFIAAASAVCLLVTFGWMTFCLNLWVGLALFLFLAAPFSACCILCLKCLAQKTPIQTRVKQAKDVLLALQGVGFACWLLDVISTVFVLDINQTSSELNPLGWPFGAVGALFYYVPITFVVYYLLFKAKSKASFYGAMMIAVVTLFMGVRNLFAALHNFSSLIPFTSPAAEAAVQSIWAALVAVLGVLNILVYRRKKRASD